MKTKSLETLKTGASFARGQSKQDYRTPADFMAALTRRFGRITVDLAASSENAQALCYFTKEDDSFKQDWHQLSGRLFLNPEFDNIAPWAEKCAVESALGAPPILFLTPASVGANWFREFVQPNAFVLALNGRLCFDGKSPYPKDCVLSVFFAGLRGFDTWNWKSSFRNSPVDTEAKLPVVSPA